MSPCLRGAIFALCLLVLTACTTGDQLSWQVMARQPRYNPYSPSDFFTDGQSARPLVPDTVARGHLHDDVLLYTGKVPAGTPQSGSSVGSGPAAPALQGTARPGINAGTPVPSGSAGQAQQPQSGTGAQTGGTQGGQPGNLPSGSAANQGSQSVAGQAGATDSDVFPFPVTMDVLQRGQSRYNVYCTPCHGPGGYGDGLVVQRGYPTPPSFHQDRLRNAPVGHFFDVITNGFGVMPSYSSQVEVRDRWAIAAYIRALQLSQHAALSDVPPDQQGKLSGGQTR